ncbi:Outer membrane porin F [bacterium HR39]|nr:Outer membrane porin F [bacterium HR39]
MRWHLRGFVIAGVLGPWLAAPQAGAFVVPPAPGSSGFVRVQAATPQAPGEEGTAARLRAVIEGIRQRLQETAPPAEEGGTPAPAAGTAQEDLRSLRERFAQLGRALADTRRERDELARRLAETEKRLAELQARGEEERRQASAALQELQKRLDEAEAARAKQQQELEALRERTATLEKEIAAERERRARAEAAARDAEQQIAELTASLQKAWDERKGLEEKLQQVQQALAGLQQESDRQLAEARERIGALEKERDELRRAGEAQSRENEQLAARLAALQQRVATLEKENRELQAVAADAVGQLKEVSDRLFEALAERERLARTVAVLRESNALLEQQLAALITGTSPAAGAGAEPAAGPAAEPAKARPEEGTPSQAEPPAAAPGPRSEASAPEETRVAAAQAGGPASGPAAVQPAAVQPLSVDGLEVSATEDGWLRTVLTGLDFEIGSAEPRAGAEEIVRRVAALIALYPDSTVRVEGHTDAIGDADRKRELSLQRARRIRDMLVAMGVDPRRIEVAGYGEERPIAPNDTPEGRARNRRIEVLIRPKPGPVPELRTVSD